MALGFARKRHQDALKPFFRAEVRNAGNGGSGVLEIIVYEQIGATWWSDSGVTAKNVKQRVDTAGAFSQIALRINSPGGDAFEGVAILNLLRSLGKPVDVFVDGIAASAASIIAMAGDTITMGSGAMMMIHNAWSVVAGNAQQLTKEAVTLAAVDQSIAQTYVDRTGQPLATVKSMMDEETWMGADECVEKGFATAKSAAPAEPKALNLAREFKALAHFAKVPPAFQPKAEEDAECECNCQNCQDGNCASCSNAGCDTANCAGCPMQENRSAGAQRLPVASVAPEVFASALARLQSNARHIDLRGKDGKILALRRFGSSRLNLAPPADGSSTQARVIGLLAPYQSPSGDLGGFEEVYQAGCFTKWLATDDPRVLFNHNIDHVLGRKSAGTARFWEEADGLHFEADLPDTQVARDLRVSLERGDIKEASAAFYIYDYAWESRSGVRTRVIKEARLVEGSPHSFAAYGDSTAKPEEVPQANAASHELEHLGARLQLLRVG